MSMTEQQCNCPAHPAVTSSGPRKSLAVVLIACAAGAVLAGGCGGGNLQSIKGAEQFKQEVLGSPQPVMMTFNKGGCATCIVLEPKINKPAKEYGPRGVKFTKMQIMSFFFAMKEKEIAEQYDVTMFPTVVLFINGAEKRRWIIRYNVDSYREALDAVAGPPPTTMPATSPTTMPATPGKP